MFPTSTAPAPEFTVARANGTTAIYKRDTPSSDWNLVITEPGDAETAIAALTATGASLTVLNDMLHLLQDAEFPTTLPTFISPTAVSVLRAEAALLRKRADAARTDAGYAGEWGDRGAAGLDKIAAAYEHAIAVFEQYPTN